MDGGGYHLFNHFWWLIFPLFWMLSRMAGLWMRHARANRALDLIKSYADQGKEPPADLLAVLRQPEPDRSTQQCGRTFSTYGWIPFFACAGSATGLTYMAWQDHWDEGLVMGAIVTACVALGFLMAMTAARRDVDRTLPK